MNKNLSIEQINDILSDLSESCLKRKYSLVASEQPDNYYEEKYQGETITKYEIYRLGIDDLHLRIERQTDSYGDSETIYSLKIVKPIVKTVTDFE